MTHQTQPQRAATYSRQSRNKAKSIDEQGTENRVAAEANQWTVVAEYSDGSSASRYATKTRADWGRVLGDIDERRFDVLILWESSRGDRTLTTWSQLLEQCRTAGVQIYVTSHGRLYDMKNDRDWRSLAEDGVDSDYEARKISGRIRRGHAGSAASGRPATGRVAYGYRRLYDRRTGVLAGQEPHPEDAPIVREIITRIAGADPVNHILLDLIARKIVTPGGRIELDAIDHERRALNDREGVTEELAVLDERERLARSLKWARTTLRTIATNPAYAGRRRHNDETYNGTWEALVDPGVFDTAQRVLADPRRRTHRPGGNRHLLSYILFCAECDFAMSYKSNPNYGEPSYACRGRGCTGIRADWLDEYISDVIVERLSQPDVYAAIAAVDDSAVLAARAEAEALALRLDEFRDSAAEPGGITAEALARIEAKLIPQIRAAEERARAAEIPPQLRGLLEPDADVRARWNQLSIPARKEVIRLLMGIRITRAPRRGSVVYFQPERVLIEWKEVGA